MKIKQSRIAVAVSVKKGGQLSLEKQNLLLRETIKYHKELLQDLDAILKAGGSITKNSVLAKCIEIASVHEVKI